MLEKVQKSSTQSTWRDVLPVSALRRHWVTRARIGNRALAIYDTPTGLYASLALCTHGGADLCDGYFDRHIIECPLHQGAFDVRDGRPVDTPATKPMTVFPARIHGEMVQVKV